MTLKRREGFCSSCSVHAIGLFAAKLKTVGVEKFEELKRAVVVLDLAMPDMDGIEAAKLMSTSDPAAPIILFTILGFEGLRDSAREAGIRVIVPPAWKIPSSLWEPSATAALVPPRIYLHL
jgi:CheY-like chemotaxis protein